MRGIPSSSSSFCVLNYEGDFSPRLLFPFGFETTRRDSPSSSFPFCFETRRGRTPPCLSFCSETTTRGIPLLVVPRFVFQHDEEGFPLLVVSRFVFQYDEEGSSLLVTPRSVFPHDEEGCSPSLSFFRSATTRRGKPLLVSFFCVMKRRGRVSPPRRFSFLFCNNKEGFPSPCLFCVRKR